MWYSISKCLLSFYTVRTHLCLNRAQRDLEVETDREAHRFEARVKEADELGQYPKTIPSAPEPTRVLHA